MSVQPLERRLHRVVVSTLIVPLVAVLTAATPAANEPAFPVLAEADRDSIRLDWSTVAGAEAYAIVDERSGQVLWRGTETSRVEQIQAPASRSLLLFADMGNASVLLAKTLAMVPATESALDPTTAVVTPIGTRLSWESASTAVPWELTVDNGNSASPVDGFTTTLSHTLTSKEAAVEVSADTVIDKVPTRLVNGYALAPPTYSAAQVGGDPQAGDVISAGVPIIRTSRVPYETYIPSEYIDAPDSGSVFDCERGDGSDYWYSGDNRGLAYESGKYRTRALATYNWYNAYTFTTRMVSPTTRYKKTSTGYSYESRRTASSEGIIMRPVSNDGRFALTQINHSVGNPYCSGMNNIDYDIRQEMYQNGGHWLYGRHDRMPNHQLHRFDQYTDGTSSVSLVFHHRLTDPKCLNFMYPCPQYQYQYSR